MTGSSSVQETILRGYIQRHGAANLTNRGTSEAWLEYLKTQVTGISGRRDQAEALWVRQLGGTGETLSDLWQNYLSKNGYTGGLQDMIRKFFTQG